LSHKDLRTYRHTPLRSRSVTRVRRRARTRGEILRTMGTVATVRDGNCVFSPKTIVIAIVCPRSPGECRDGATRRNELPGAVASHGTREQRRIHTGFVAPERFGLRERHGTPRSPWANEHRWGVPAYASAAPLGTGGLSARLGAYAFNVPEERTTGWPR